VPLPKSISILLSEKHSGGKVKKNKYQIGDMFLMSHGSLYRGIICEIVKEHEDDYIIYWTNPNGTVTSTGYNKWEINTNIGHGHWKHIPVVKQ